MTTAQVVEPSVVAEGGENRKEGAGRRNEEARAGKRKQEQERGGSRIICVGFSPNASWNEKD